MDKELSGIGIEILQLIISMPDELFGQIFLDVEVRQKLNLSNENASNYLLNLKTYMIGLITAGIIKLESGMTESDISLANAYTQFCIHEVNKERNVVLEKLLTKFLITLPNKE